ncbi:hypothetical protein [Aeromonas phage Asp37]|nr:hypothetical protein [Aeromonas phage Asp37]
MSANFNHPIPVVATCLKTGKETLYSSIQECADKGHFSYQYVQLCVHGSMLRHCNHTFKPAPGVVLNAAAKRPRLQQVATLRNQGMANKQIAAELGLKLDTVQKYAKQAARAKLTTHIMPE